MKVVPGASPSESATRTTEVVEESTGEVLAKAEQVVSTEQRTEYTTRAERSTAFDKHRQLRVHRGLSKATGMVGNNVSRITEDVQETVAPEFPSPETRTDTSEVQPTGSAVPAPVLPSQVPAGTNAPTTPGTGSGRTEVPQPVITKPHDNLPSDEPLTPAPQITSPSCNTLSCKGLVILNDHPMLYISVFLILAFIFCLRCKLCGGRRARDPRGEYRAVGRMLANNFDTDISDEDMNFYASDEDDEDPNSNSNGWSTHKGTIELGSIGVDEANGGLTLEEMNG